MNYEMRGNVMPLFNLINPPNYNYNYNETSILLNLATPSIIESFINSTTQTTTKTTTPIKTSTKQTETKQTSNSNIIKDQCDTVDTSQIGAIFLFLPKQSMVDSSFEIKKSDGLVFKLNHYLSLLLLTKLFKSTIDNRLLFFYLNDDNRPISNQYNRWIDDPQWSNKLPIENIKFINLNYTMDSLNRYNFYDILTQVKYNAIEQFDKLYKKEHIILVTSDIIIGPRILSCFSQDSLSSLFTTNHNPIQTDLSRDCYEALHTKNSDGYFSFLYKLPMMSHIRDFSGILLWRVDQTDNNEKQVSFINKLTDDLVKETNIYKCAYKSDVLKTSPHNQLIHYATTFCVFGYEINVHDMPHLHNFFNAQKSTDNYFNELIRKFIYKKVETITYNTLLVEAKIPNVVHLIWFSDSTNRHLKFIEYLCLKSILSVLKPDKVKIHGDNKPSKDCPYWNEITLNSKVQWVYKERPDGQFYKQDFSKSPIQHLADVARLIPIFWKTK
jgi:hypothetical protein